jgi:glycosyltransferase involved in cell wall biosynthesis
MVTLDSSQRRFVVIGAIKAGTTSLHQALSAHPEIGMPSRKELDYFSTVQHPTRDEYLGLFRWCRGSVIGEASPSYAMYPTYGDVARRMAEVIPETKIILCIREPLDRMRSHYRHEVLRSRENRPADRALGDVKYLGPSLYGMQIERYLKYFDPDQIAIVSMSDLWGRPDDSLQGVFDFLGVDVAWRDAKGIRLVFESSKRPALTTEVERMRNTPVMRAVLGRLPTEFKRQVGFRLPGAAQATKRARTLIESEQAWTPSDAIQRWIEQDAENLERFAARCHQIGSASTGGAGMGLVDELGSRTRERGPARIETRGSVPPSRPVGFTPAPRGRRVPAPKLVEVTGETVPVANVSIAMPIYEPSPGYLAAALDGLREQTVSPIEVIVTDDSTPSRRDLVARLGVDLPLSYRPNVRRLGMVENWNEAVRATTGSHVIVLHQDDILEPTMIERTWRVFAAHPGLAICGVGEVRIDERGNELCDTSRPNHRERLFISRGMHALGYDELTYLMLRNGQILGEPSALVFSRELFDEVGGFDATFRQSVDIDLALRMARAGGAVYLNERLVRRRVHAEQATKSNIVNGHNLLDRRELYRRHAASQVLGPTADDRVKANLAVRAGFDGGRALRYGRWSVAREAASQVMEYRPSPRALTERLIELSLWTNDDAR